MTFWLPKLKKLKSVLFLTSQSPWNFCLAFECITPPSLHLRDHSILYFFNWFFFGPAVKLWCSPVLSDFSLLSFYKPTVSLGDFFHTHHLNFIIYVLVTPESKPYIKLISKLYSQISLCPVLDPDTSPFQNVPQVHQNSMGELPLWCSG